MTGETTSKNASRSGRGSSPRSSLAPPGNGDAERRQGDHHLDQRKAEQAHAEKGGKAEQRGERLVAMRSRQADADGDDEAGCGGGNAAQDAVDDSDLAELGVEHAERDEDHERYGNHARDGGGGAGGTVLALTEAHRKIDDVRAGQELAEAERLGEVLVAHPVASLNERAVRPVDRAAEARQADLHEGDEQIDETGIAASWRRVPVNFTHPHLSKRARRSRFTATR